LKQDGDIERLQKSFTKPFHNERHTNNVLLDYLLKIIALEAGLEEKRDALA
jgi:hypothetical protein